MKDVEGSVVFSDDMRLVEKAEKQKKPRGKKPGSKSTSPDDSEKLQADTATVLEGERLTSHELTLGKMRSGGLAADCVLALLETQGLAKQVCRNTRCT
jgi:hypothetical protein